MIIHLQNVGKSFGETVVLQGIQAAVEPGEHIGIIGENGAGKTTLLRILCREYAPDEGEYSLARGATLGYLEQNSTLNEAQDVYGEMRGAYAPVLEAMAEMQVLEKKLANTPNDGGLLERHARP